MFTAAAILVIFVLMVFISKQTLPVPPKEILENPSGPTNLFLLAAFGELLLMPGGLGLYFALKAIMKTPMFLATALMLLAVPLFLVSRGLIISLSSMSGRYLAASSETMREAYLASAEHTIETQNVYATMALILLCVASIIIGFVMLKGTFGRGLGWLVIAAGVLTIFSPFGVMLGIPVIVPFIGLILTAVWQLIAGSKLFKMGSEI